MRERFLTGYNDFVLPFMIGMVFILSYCIIALIRIIVQLPKEDRKRFFISLVTPKTLAKNVRDIFCDCLLHVKIWKRNKLLGYMHSSIAFGWFMLIVVGHIEVLLYTPHRAKLFYYPIFFRYFVAETESTMKGAVLFFLMDFFLLVVLSGIALAIIKRIRSRLFGMRKYKQARAAYDKALLTGESVVADLKPNIQAAIELCDSCLFYDDLTARCFRQIARMKKEGNATQAEVADYASYAIQYIEQIYRFNPDDYYLKRIELMKGLLMSMDLQVKFTFVEWKTFAEGNPIPGVEIWIYRGFTPLSSNSFSSDKRFRRILKKEGMNFQQVGESGADGIAEIELDRTNLPTGILFRPKEDAPQKIVYMSFEDLMRRAQGTYMKKQFRVKMYTK